MLVEGQVAAYQTQMLFSGNQAGAELHVPLDSKAVRIEEPAMVPSRMMLQIRERSPALIAPISGLIAGARSELTLVIPVIAEQSILAAMIMNS